MVLTIPRFLKLKPYLLIDLMNVEKFFVGSTSRMIGMNEWFAPQISEHCPVNKPSRFLWMISWFSRPGEASAFTPIDGMAHE